MSVHHAAKAAATVTALAASAMFAPCAASAEDRPVLIYGEVANARTELVSFAHLDLGDRSDQRKLRNRVLAAVERVCLRDIGRDGLQDRNYYACEEASIDAASTQITEAVSRAGHLALGGGAPIAAAAIRVSAF